MVSPGAAPAHGAGRLGESGNRQNACDGEEEQVQGLELPWRTAEQDFGGGGRNKYQVFC